MYIHTYICIYICIYIFAVVARYETKVLISHIKHTFSKMLLMLSNFHLACCSIITFIILLCHNVYTLSEDWWGLLDSPGKIWNFQTFSRVRPRSKFPTEEITKSAGDNIKVLRGEPHKYTVLILKKVHRHIYSYIYIYIPGWPKNTQVAWQHLSADKPSETLH